MISWILTSVFLFWSKFQLIRYTPRVWGKSANGTVFRTYVLQTAPLYHELIARSVLETVAAMNHARLNWKKISVLIFFFLRLSTHYHHAWLRRVVCMRTFLQTCILSEKATITSWLGVKNPNCSANFSLKSFNAATHFSSSCSNTSKDTPQRQTATMIVQHFLTCTQWQHYPISSTVS